MERLVVTLFKWEGVLVVAILFPLGGLLVVIPPLCEDDLVVGPSED